MKYIFILLIFIIIGCNDKDIAPTNELYNTTFVHFDHIIDQDSIFSVVEFKKSTVDINYKSLTTNRLISIGTFNYSLDHKTVSFYDSDNSISTAIVYDNTLYLGGLYYKKR